jgi:hypothetical protein
MMFTQEFNTRRLLKSLQTLLVYKVEPSNQTINLQIYLSAYGVTAYSYRLKIQYLRLTCNLQGARLL